MKNKNAKAWRIRCLLIGLAVGALITCYASKWSGLWCNHLPETITVYFSPGA